MKKLLSLLTIVGLTATTTVVACGSDILKIDKIQLDSVLTKTTLDNKTTLENVIDLVLKQNLESGILASDFEIKAGSFIAPTYGKAGSIMITAKEDSKYTGEVKVIISSLNISKSDVEKIMNEIRNYFGSKTDLKYVNLFEDFFASIIGFYKENYQLVLTQQEYDEIKNGNTDRTIILDEFRKLMVYISHFAMEENFSDLINEKWKSPEISMDSSYSIVLINDQKLDFNILVHLDAKITGGVVDTIFWPGIQDISFVIK